MSNLPQVNARPVTPTTPIDAMDLPPGMTDKKLVAKATAKARPRYSRVTHKAIGSKGAVHRMPPKKTVAPGKQKLPFNRAKA